MPKNIASLCEFVAATMTQDFLSRMITNDGLNQWALLQRCGPSWLSNCYQYEAIKMKNLPHSAKLTVKFRLVILVLTDFSAQLGR